MSLLLVRCENWWCCLNFCWFHLLLSTKWCLCTTLPRQIISISDGIQWFGFILTRSSLEWFSLFCNCTTTCISGWCYFGASSWLLFKREASCLRFTFILSLLVFLRLRYLDCDRSDFFFLIKELWIRCNIFTSLFSGVDSERTYYTTRSLCLLW